MAQELSSKIRVWDLPTRLFHWALAGCVVALVTTAKIGGEAMIWHGRLGYAVGSLLLFRLIWGFVGGHWSRFRSFPPSPAAAFRYLRGSGQPTPGHSPLGALSVYALLLFLFAQVATGLFSDDQVEYSGPLGVHVANDTVRLFTRYHKNIGQYVLIALVVLHLAAIAYYHWGKRRNLVGPMVHGDTDGQPGVAPSRDDWRTRTAALVVLGACSGAVTWLVKLGG
jgi:cytochrome b